MTEATISNVSERLAAGSNALRLTLELTGHTHASLGVCLMIGGRRHNLGTLSCPVSEAPVVLFMLQAGASSMSIPSQLTTQFYDFKDRLHVEEVDP